MEVGETVEQAAAREVREETGAELSPTAFDQVRWRPSSLRSIVSRLCVCVCVCVCVCCVLWCYDMGPSSSAEYTLLPSFSLSHLCMMLFAPAELLRAAWRGDARVCQRRAAREWPERELLVRPSGRILSLHTKVRLKCSCQHVAHRAMVSSTCFVVSLRVDMVHICPLYHRLCGGQRVNMLHFWPLFLSTVQRCYMWSSQINTSYVFPIECTNRSWTMLFQSFDRRGTPCVHPRLRRAAHHSRHEKVPANRRGMVSSNEPFARMSLAFRLHLAPHQY